MSFFSKFHSWQEIWIECDFCDWFLFINVHRSNILVSDEPLPRVRICDFGISKEDANVDGDRTATTGFQCTFAFTAPERLSGRKFTTKCDVYSFGMTIFQMVSGTNPWAELVTINSYGLGKCFVATRTTSCFRPKFTVARCTSSISDIGLRKIVILGANCQS